jgi:mannose/cellobiose epimerase-like protein (N-acyl-D-glucosamine 2-epimerase family)
MQKAFTPEERAPNTLDFSFSDLVAGYVKSFDVSSQSFVITTTDGRDFAVTIGANAYAEVVRNLGEGFLNATDQINDMLVPGRYLFVYGIYYPETATSSAAFEAKHIVFPGRTESSWVFERPDWWVKQITQLANFYLQAEFGHGPIDYRGYRTNLNAVGQKQKVGRQETDTISRLVYGFASAFMLTGNDRFLEAAEAGTRYLRNHLRFEDKSEGVVFWYHAVDIQADGTERKIFASEFGDDFEAIPCYEQIYALAGPIQTYRITGDRLILNDAEATIRLFERFYKDKTELGGYFSHVDPVTLSPHADSLGHNKARKNWNSVGDHAPAYLINLYLATGDQRWADFLEYTFDTISQRFPDYEESPFVQEKFFHDWSKDQSWGWQQNRAVVGHNLKIAWNLMRMQSLKGKDSYLDLAQQIAELMPQHGMDKQRGGWYDVVERVLQPGQKFHRYAWHDRKAWWQQEQGILAYLILNGVTGKPEYKRLARESAAFYNAWFLDTEVGGVYFNVLANGHPYALGTERGKGSHSMAGYHSFELAYLAAVYTNLLINHEPMDFWFKPMPGAFPDGKLRVSPDILPAGSVRIADVWIDGQPYDQFDAEALTVDLPQDRGQVKVRVRLMPTTVRFGADVIEVKKGVARISLEGRLTAQDLKDLEEAIEEAIDAGAKSLTFEVEKLETICGEALRYLAFLEERRGAGFKISFTGAKGEVAEAIEGSEILVAGK